MNKILKTVEILKGIKNIKEILEKVNLNWHVRQEDLFLENGMKVPNARINIRDDNDAVLGIVTDRYEIVNNEDAFDWVNELLKNDITAENAGELNNSKCIYLQADLKSTYIDSIQKNMDCKLVFTNSHDGKGSIRVNVLPVIDGNIININLGKEKRSWSAMHTKKVKEKMDIAKETLSLANSYIQELMQETVRLSKIKFTKKQKEIFLNAMFPVNGELSERKYDNIEERKNDLRNCIEQDTAFGFIMGTSNYIMKLQPKRKTKDFDNNKFLGIINGYYLLDRAYSIVNKTLYNH